MSKSETINSCDGTRIRKYALWPKCSVLLENDAQTYATINRYWGISELSVSQQIASRYKLLP